MNYSGDMSPDELNMVFQELRGLNGDLNIGDGVFDWPLSPQPLESDMLNPLVTPRQTVGPNPPFPGHPGSKLSSQLGHNFSSGPMHQSASSGPMHQSASVGSFNSPFPDLRQSASTGSFNTFTPGISRNASAANPLTALQMQHHAQSQWQIAEIVSLNQLLNGWTEPGRRVPKSISVPTMAQLEQAAWMEQKIGNSRLNVTNKLGGTRSSNSLLQLPTTASHGNFLAPDVLGMPNAFDCQGGHHNTQDYLNQLLLLQRQTQTPAPEFPAESLTFEPPTSTTCSSLITKPPKADGSCKLLEDFRSGLGSVQRLEDIENCVVEFSKDQLGSRFIQKQMDVAGRDVVRRVVGRIIRHGRGLMSDVFGNYVMQKCLEVCSAEQRQAIVAEMRGHVLELALQMCGCRVVQRALETSPLETKLQIVSEIQDHIIALVEDQNGNHVVQKAIEHVPPEKMVFVLAAFKGKMRLMASHCYGCRVIQRFLENFLVDHVASLLEEVSEPVVMKDLMRDQYGNYVMQHILLYGPGHLKGAMRTLIQRNLVVLSCHKFASNVVEKCFTASQNYWDSCQQMIAFVLEPKGTEPAPIFQLVSDRFANYVVQRMIDVATTEQKHQIVTLLQSQIPQLKRLPFGRHIAAKLTTLQSSLV